MIKKILISAITLYQTQSPLRGHCRFYPTCSQYTKEAIATYGVGKGIILGLQRLLRCNPLFPSGVDFIKEHK